ncbi:ImpB/MucB/SamB family protein [Oesophagostomum dentatum]|uniref:ImpB/MucB/SamB family protein n=1 Tax=Oesophagostomum dentatum TaxID=61180 RepID=A0A0B1TB47_OESDE|nr:ImpB/MucB/SamB family protein [Oesophagostomum dentatum]
METITANAGETHIQIGDASVIIMSDNESDGSDRSEDLFDNCEDSCDVPEMRANTSTSGNFGRPSTSGITHQYKNTANKDSYQTSSDPSKTLAQNSAQSSFGSVSSKESDLRENMQQSMVRLENEDNSTRNFGHYMQLKKDKLRYQVNVLDRPQNRSSEIFSGISIFVNGHTEPTALELRQLIQLHGGEYHCYYQYGITSFIIATSLAAAKHLRSRLHLISTLAQELKEYVTTLRTEESNTFIGRETLGYLKDNNYKPPSSRIIFHVDLDCFFVSVALRDRPDLKDKAVAITHSKGVGAGFSELASVSYAARRCGLRNGMIVRDAIKRCPQLICLPYAFDEYKVVSKAIYTIVARYTLEIKAVSCDEMYVDCTKLLNEMSISDVKAFAEHLRAEIKRETGCTASVGIGRSTLMARLATRYAKPDGVRYVSAEESHIFIANEKVKNLPGLGYQTYNKLVANFGK